MSEHNGLPRRRVVWIILKLATPYQLLLTMSVKLTQFVTHSLNARALSSVLAAYLPWVARTHSPRGGAVMSTTRPHTCTGTTHPEVESPRLDRGGARRREGDCVGGGYGRACGGRGGGEQRRGGRRVKSNQRGAISGESTVESTVESTEIRSLQRTGLALGRGGLTWGGRNNFKTKPAGRLWDSTVYS
jgi:hypothetical protein